LARLLYRFRFLTGALLLALLLALLALNRHVQFDQSLTSFFPADSPIVGTYERVSSRFGNDNFIFIVYDDPDLLTPAGMDRVDELAAAVSPSVIPAVSSVETLTRTPLFWRFDDEVLRLAQLPAFLRPAAMSVARSIASGSNSAAADPSASGGLSLDIGPAIRSATPTSLPALRHKITTHPLLQGTLITPDGRSTTVLVHLRGMADQDVRRTVADLRTRADAFASRHGLSRPALVGPPVLLADGFAAIERDGQRLALAGMALIGLVTLTATHSLWWAILPILAGWTVWLATSAVLGSLNLKLSLSGGPLVAQIIVLTMPAASHLAIHFRDALLGRPESDPSARRLAAIETLHNVAGPVFWCALTGMLGYGALAISQVVPVRQFGLVLGACTLVAAILTLVVSPVAMAPPWPMHWAVRSGAAATATHGVNRMLAWVVRHPALIVLGVLALALPLVAGMTRLEYESNYINAFKPAARVVRDYRFIEERLGGIGLVSLVVPIPGNSLTTADLDRFRQFDRDLTSLPASSDSAPHNLGVVSRVISLATVLDPEGRLASLDPEASERALNTKIELIGLAPQGRLMSNFWNPDAHRARILVRIPERQDARTKEATFLHALDLAKRIFGPDCNLSGLSYLLTRTTRSVMATSWTTFAWATVSILVMLVLAFRSLLLAVLAILPSILAVGVVLGLTGWARVKLDLATALVASVALGLAVDDTFHCLLQFRRERRLRTSFTESLFASYSVTGPGVILSSLAVAAGFAVLWFSEFVPFSNFGLMVGVATLGSSLGNLVLLPACLTLAHREAGDATPHTPQPSSSSVGSNPASASADR
jgi:predicted RND superfamily exporter protein